MAGADGLNPQGIKKTKEVRSCFPLAFEGYRLCGGDFKAFEVVLAEATYNDPKLREDLLSGLKIHALFGEELYPDETYESILASEGTEDDKYSKSKSGVFSQIYGGDENTLKVKLGIDLETGRTARENFERRYPGIGAKRKRIFDMFCSMRQPGGIGSRVVWTDPKEFVESLFGFRRYFTLENAICKALFDLAEQPPISWKVIKIKVIRRDRQQTCEGATRSALFGAAFAIQSANMRAAANHEIQSSGAQITKYVQRKIWDLQPSGVNNWIVQPMNIHDEILTPTLPEYVDKVEQVVKESVEFFKPKVPLIGIDWFTNMKSWAEKKG
jgi:DNA polymerase I-like protein with 3'-5' exonuclease and polymerase domains